MKYQRNKLYLNGGWELFYADHGILVSDGFVMEDDPELNTPRLCTVNSIKSTGYPEINAAVPGNFELDLFRAGFCGDPFFGTNVIEMQKYETFHMYYVRSFSYSGEATNAFLVLEGIDTAAEIYLNGRLLLRPDNMFIEHSVFAGDFLMQGTNEIVVHIKPAVLYAKKYPDYEGMFSLPYSRDSLQMRKAASMYGWDIMPRLVSGGIWRDIYIEHRRENRISDLFIFTQSVDLAAGKATLCVCAEVSGFTETDGCALRIAGVCGESGFDIIHKISNSKQEFTFNIENCLFWMPANYGKTNIYSVTAELLCGDTVIDAARMKVGIRTVALDRTEKNGGKFDFYINGQRIFVMGTNWVPVDAFHSRDKERIGEILPMLEDIGCNMVRCWGGNVYECDELFDYCDTHGILIWQDFGMACGVYPGNRDFLDRFSNEAASVIKKYRNHPSLAVWAGDNECDLAIAWSGSKADPNDNAVTRKLLPKLLRELDPTRPYIPSSPYVDPDAYKSGKLLAEDHLWGPRDYFKGDFYGTAKAKFASETGYHGCPPPQSLRRFLSEKAALSWHTGDGVTVDNEWLAHCASPELRQDAAFAYRIPLMVSQIKVLFGEAPEDINDFSIAGQISQGEAMKYFIERFRLQKSTHGGIIWWNLIDGWPQISDSVVDYYGEKKLAYHYIKRAQNPVSVIFGEPDRDGGISVIADSELCHSVVISYKITDLRTGEVLCSGKVETEAHSSTHAGNLHVKPNDFLFAQWEYPTENGVIRGENHFISDARGSGLHEFVSLLKKAGIIK